MKEPVNAKQPVIHVRDASVNLGERPVLSALTVRVDQPGLVALAGPNGAGKSTLLRALAGLVPLQAGSISIDGQALATMAPEIRARSLAYMPQERQVQWDLSARTVVSIGRLPYRQPRAAETATDRIAIDAALARVDASHLADRPVLSLSGGERARILMARALAQEARILLADEPAAGLDPAHQWGLFETLANTAAGGVRVVVAMHDLTLISRFAAHLLLLKNGKLEAAGQPAAVLTPIVLAAVYGITARTIDGLIIPTGRTGAAAA